MGHRLCAISSCGLNGLKKADEHPTTGLQGLWYLCLRSDFQTASAGAEKMEAIFGKDSKV